LLTNDPKSQTIEFEAVNFAVSASSRKTQGKIKVSQAMLLKTHGEKMSDCRSLAMLMKNKQLKSLSGDVDERKGGYLA